MTEEVKLEETQETQETQETVEEVVELSPVEEEAMEQGWLPKDQWEAAGRDPNDWRSAKEFKERGEFFRTIHQQKREIKQTQAALDSLRKHHQFVFDQAYRKAKAELRKERREALRSEDLDQVDEIEQQMEQLDSQYMQQKAELEKAPEVTGQPPVEFELWKQRNGWYDNDEDLRDFADLKGMQYARKHPGVPPAEVLQHVEKVVKQKFPEKFGVKRAAPNAVASVDITSNRKKAEPSYELDETETKIMNDLVRAGVMTKEQYIADLKKVKGEK